MESVFAQTSSFSIQSLPDPVKFKTIGDVLSAVIPLVFALAGFGLFLMIVSSGFTLLTSAGDPKKIEAGKQRLTYAIVGFLVVFASFWLVQIAGKIFGITEVQTIFR